MTKLIELAEAIDYVMGKLIEKADLVCDEDCTNPECAASHIMGTTAHLLVKINGEIHKLSIKGMGLNLMKGEFYITNDKEIEEFMKKSEVLH